MWDAKVIFKNRKSPKSPKMWDAKVIFNNIKSTKFAHSGHPECGSK
jgi:hypothetical protein